MQLLARCKLIVNRLRDRLAAETRVNRPLPAGGQHENTAHGVVNEDCAVGAGLDFDAVGHFFFYRAPADAVQNFFRRGKERAVKPRC